MRALLADAAHLGDVGLHDVEAPRLQPRLERLPAREHLAAGDRHRRVPPQEHVVVQGVRRQRLFEPGHVVAGQHLRRPQGPFVALLPEGVAAARVDHQQRRPGRRRRAPPGRSPRRCAVLPRPNGPQPILNARKPCALSRARCSASGAGLLHQQRGVGPDAVAVAAAQQASDRLAGGLAQQVPQGDVDAADGVRDRAAAAQPEGVLVQLLADPFRLQGVLAAIERLQQRQRRSDQRPRW